MPPQSPPPEQPAGPVPLPQPPLPVEPVVSTVTPGSSVAPQTGGAPAQPADGQPQPVVPAEPYDFITKAEKPVKPPFWQNLPGGSSLAARALMGAGVLFVLLIIVIVIKNLAFGFDGSAFIGVIQDQQELIHLSNNAIQQPNLSVGTQNFASTALSSLTSAQAGIISYLSANGQKTSPKVLNLKVSAATDSQLTTAAAATTYDQTFQGIMNTKLGTYLNDLKQAYQQTNGQNGHILLNNYYKQGQLLLTQLDSEPQ